MKTGAEAEDRDAEPSPTRTTATSFSGSQLCAHADGVTASMDAVVRTMRVRVRGMDCRICFEVIGVAMSEIAENRLART
ncbi:MAG: hypothetical protein KDC98_22535 [Planctomycetes bacterium]|nr:hypothetical protein [Planctomycetota bacterium]